VHQRRLQVLVAAVLTASALAVLYSVYAFGQHRFFTVDEYQYGHATWLVSQGERPYLDFYEHHFPLSYVLHAPLADGDASFPERALRLRVVAFSYVLFASLLLGLATWRATGNPLAALLAVIIPPSVGFGLMSAVDYRADNFGAFLFLACLALLELNRSAARLGGEAEAGATSGRGWLAASCGVLLALSLLMTQKMVVLGGASVGLLFILDRLRSSAGGDVAIARPLAFCLGVAATLSIFLAAGAYLGLLGRALDITIFEAIAHEVFYPAVSWREYVFPYLCAAPFSTGVIAILALAYFALAPARDRIFWGVPLAVALVGGALIKAQYPYNYVLLCFLIGLCAARGFALLVDLIQERMSGRAQRVQQWIPLLYCAPLALLPSQLGFVRDTTSNLHQLDLLAKIERYSGPDDAVIDNSGGALFRQHGSYFYQHGRAHRTMFEDYFATQLVDDYRRSQALLWLIDYRLLDLPEAVHSYFMSHYVRVDGSLFALGFHSPRSRGDELVVDIDVIKAGDYYVFPAPLRLSAVPIGRDAPDRDFDLMIDGEPILGDTVRLEVGERRVTVLPGAPAYFLTLVPPDAFLLNEKDRFWRELEGAKAYQLLFEYGEGCR
jgi:hypothetical protein